MDLLNQVGTGRPTPRVCVIGAGPCGLTTVKNLRAVGLTDIVCYDDGATIGGNWAFDERPERTSVYETTHLISSKRMSEFEDYPMPVSYPDFPSHSQILSYFTKYAAQFRVLPHVRLRTHVEHASLTADNRWRVRSNGPGGLGDEIFDYLIVCSGHHREPFMPDHPGTFTGQILHSREFKRAEAFRGKRVLVVGGGNSACDIAVDVARVARRTCISMRRGYYVIPKILFGRPVDVLYSRSIRRLRINRLPRRFVQYALAALVRLGVGPWEKYGLQQPQCWPLEMHPTLNTNILSALRDGLVSARPGIARLDGHDVHFVDGAAESFDTIIWATGFRIGFPFLDESVFDWKPTETPPLYLKMMHKRLRNLFFIGLFQPLGCIWRLADRQARIAALQIVGRLDRPADITAQIDKEIAVSERLFERNPRHAVEVDYHIFAGELANELALAASPQR
jgi:cation diffusion facilitator CzcD-associated flavoprotein CzcO